MKTLSAVLVVISGLFLASVSVACPACNIHNYLSNSIGSSTNIYIGEVVRQIDDRNAEVKVIKVLRGSFTPETLVQNKMYDSKRYIGEKFIFSNPTSWPPTFEAISPEFEDEVLFLIEKDPVVNNVSDAVKRVQSISVFARNLGMGYIKSHHKECVESLIAEINKIMGDELSGKDVFYGGYRLGQLVNALFLAPSEAGTSFAIAQLNDFATQNPVVIDWKADCGLFPSRRGLFLKDILCQTQKNPAIANVVNARLKEIYPTLSGGQLAEASFAMIESKVATVDSLKEYLTTADAIDMLALGLYFAGNNNARNWNFDEAYPLWETALLLSRNLELKQIIKTKIENSEKNFKRKAFDNKNRSNSRININSGISITP